MKQFILVLFTAILSSAVSAQLVVDNTITPQQAVEDILVGEGIEIFNITFSGDANQIGSFNSSASNILIEDGMMMATGDCNVAIGPNNSGSSTVGGGNFGISDPDLDLLSTFNTNDATVLEFDFIASGDSIKFNYTFGSEEYNEYVCGSVNDAFGFFLSGPGITGPFSNNAINLAIVPGTDIPVTINTVNLGVSGSAGTPSNCEQVSPDWDQNTEFYVDNENNGDPNSTQMDGFTVVLTAEAEVQCGEQYHIKIAIADAGDTAFDSCVFLEAGSFTSSAAISSSVPNAPPSLPDLTMLEGCVDGVFTVFRPNVNEQDTLYLEIGGDALLNEDYFGLPDFVVFPEGELTLDIPVTTVADELEEGIENITLTYSYINACGDADTVIATLNIMDYFAPTLDLPEEIFLCNGENQNVSGVPDGGFAPFSYSWTTGSTSSNINVSSDGPSQIGVEVTDYCENTAVDSFIVTLPPPFLAIEEAEICLGLATEILAAGGAPPYTHIYPADSLEYIGNNQFEGIYEGEYEVTIIDQCGDEHTIPVIVEACETSIPNVFSPNSDSVNDTFFIEGNEGFPGSRLEIYNRWGNLVYESDNYQNNWRGEELPEGTYFYIYTRADGERFSGSVMLLRKATGR